jgi:diguanylate cyclase (GGDEF)-like protein
MRTQRTNRRRATNLASGPELLLVAPEREARALLPALLEQGWRVARVNGARAAERLLEVEPVELVLVAERATPAANLTLLRRLTQAAPGTRRIVIGGTGSPTALLSYANRGGAHFVLAPPLSPRQLVQAVLQVRNELEYERAALLRTTDAGVVVAALQARMEERARELSRTNRELRRALRQVAEKNRELTLLNESLRIQSTTDALTGLYNRREFLNRIRIEWGRFKRYRRPLSLVMLDIDHFKAINDTYGHECGDVVLRELGMLIARNKRALDVSSRIGGEEFLVLLPETSLEIAFHVAEDLRNLIADHPFDYEGTRLNIRVSVGVSGALEQSPPDVESFMNLADKAMYRAKREGRNRTVVLDSQDRSRVARQSPNRRAPHAAADAVRPQTRGGRVGPRRRSGRG